jgi:hypothetical protein
MVWPHFGNAQQVAEGRNVKERTEEFLLTVTWKVLGNVRYIIQIYDANGPIPHTSDGANSVAGRHYWDFLLV